MQNSRLNSFFEKLENYIRQKELIRLTLAAKRDKMSDLKKLIVSPVELKRGYCLNFVYRHNTKDITKNFDIEEGLKLLQEALENDFRNADLFAKSENLNLVIQPGGNVQLKSHPPTLSTSLSFVHDKPKERLVNTRNNVYLRELGIMNANGELRREMGDKYKQINQYIELLAPTLKELPHNESYSVADMGSGKGYLTFALYDYLTNGLKHAVSMRGIEFRQDLVDTCNNIARKADFENLEFIKGAIENTELEKIDVLIALHACDTATDDAIFRGISSGAELIVCAPCCHKQIRKAMNVANELSNITRFGILKERQAEIITDTIRAMILEAYGYKTNVIEFVSLEHTPKNVMIVGRKIPGRNPGRDKILGEIDAIKKIYGIEKHYLESLLNI